MPAYTPGAYPTGREERRVGFEPLRRLVGDIFRGCGMSEPDARLLADSLAVADLRGVHSHGVMRVPEYVEKLTTGGVDPRGVPRVRSDAGAALVVDGANSMGLIAAAFGMRSAIRRAGETGVAVAAVGGSNHCGAMAYLAMMALEKDMIGVATTNALPTMAPWGGREKIVGINPVAIALPAASEHPLVVDTAFSGASHGKIRIYEQKGARLPPGWALTAEGEPTTDPRAAIDGLLAPIGGYKGVNLAIVIGALSTLLSGAAYGTELGNMVEGPRPGCDGHLTAALDVAAFESVERFKARADLVVRQIRESALAKGAERIYAPGGLEAATSEGHLAAGIPLAPETVAGLLDAAARWGVAAELGP